MAIDFTKIPNAHIAVDVVDAPSKFRDTLHIQFAEVAGLTQEQIEAKVAADGKKRVDDWKAFVIEQSSKPPVVPTKEEIQADVERQAEQIATSTASLIAAKPDPKELEALIAKLKESLDSLSAVKVADVEVKP